MAHLNPADSEADSQTCRPEGAAPLPGWYRPAYRLRLLLRAREKHDLHGDQDYREFLTWLYAWPRRTGTLRVLLQHPDINAKTFLFTRQIRQWHELMNMYCSQSRRLSVSETV